MRRALLAAALAAALGKAALAARCTTVLDPRALTEYESYVAAVEQSMRARFEAGPLAWLPEAARQDGAARLAAGKLVKWNLSDAALNRKMANWNGTVIHWIGGIRIRRAGVSDLAAVLQDYDGYRRVFDPMVFESETPAPGKLVLGLRQAYRFASIFPQHYAFQLKGRMDRAGGEVLWLHLRSDEIRESDSGVPGRDDLLEPYRDHGIMWALNAWWRARPMGDNVYLEFETISLARSAQAFVCKIGIIPIPRSVVSSAMDSLPAESLITILEGTRAECERRATRSWASRSAR